MNNYNEECDDGNTNDNDACNNACELASPACIDFNFTVTPSTGYIPKLVTGSWNNLSGYTLTLDR